MTNLTDNDLRHTMQGSTTGPLKMMKGPQMDETLWTKLKNIYNHYLFFPYPETPTVKCKQCGKRCHGVYCCDECYKRSPARSNKGGINHNI